MGKIRSAFEVQRGDTIIGAFPVIVRERRNVLTRTVTVREYGPYDNAKTYRQDLKYATARAYKPHK